MVEWDTIFANAFESVKQDITKFYGSRDLKEITPNEQAILIGVNKLPFPVEIIDVEVDNQTYSHLKDKICQLVHYNLAQIGKTQVKYFGKVSSKKGELVKVLVKHFGISKKDAISITDSLTKNFEYTGFSLNDESYIQFSQYDIRRNQDDFSADFHSLFYNDFNDYFVRRFQIEKEKDFNSIHSLKPDSVLSPLDLLMPDTRTILSLEKLQDTIADIQFSPKVPDSIKIEFQRAKDLFVFSYFKYDFITLSVRSALFAYEIAMKSRYIQSLNGKAVIKYDSEVMHEFTNPSFSTISDFLYQMQRKKNWKLKHVLVNEKKFPSTMKEVMNWLIENGIPKWKFRMYEAARKIRNDLAHPEQSTILSESSASLLHRIAYDINEIFEK